MKHDAISFDLWGTLIKANPQFKDVKNDMIRRYSSFPNKEMFNDYFINDQISIIKRKHDDLVEAYGTQPNTKHLFAELCSVFSIAPSKFNDFYREYQHEFTEFMPSLYSEGTMPVLEKLKSDGYCLYISSNTLFTSPEAMDIMCMKLELTGRKKRPVSNCRFSGDKGISKPNKAMFFERTDFHVGDNIFTDGGCTKYGIEFFQINSNNQTIIDLYNHVSLR